MKLIHDAELLPNRAHAKVVPATLRFVCAAAALSAAVMLSGCNKLNPKTAGTVSSAAPTTTTTAAATTTTAADASVAVDSNWPKFPARGWSAVDGLRVREAPDTNNYPIGGLHKGEPVTVLAKQGDWFKISFKGGVAYVSAAYLSSSEVASDPTTAAPAATAAATTAKAATTTTKK